MKLFKKKKQEVNEEVKIFNTTKFTYYTKEGIKEFTVNNLQFIGKFSHKQEALHPTPIKHRLDGPAVIIEQDNLGVCSKHRILIYIQDGKYHREDGPAIIWQEADDYNEFSDEFIDENSSDEYYLYDVKIDNLMFMSILNIKYENDNINLLNVFPDINILINAIKANNTRFINNKIKNYKQTY